MFGYKKLQEENARLTVRDNSHKSELRKKEDEIERLNDLLKSERRERAAKDEDAKVEKRTVERKHNEQVENLQADVANLESYVEVLEGQITDQNELDEREIKLDHREKVLATHEVNADNLAEKMADVKRTGEKDGEKRFQAGYADGLADGLRKAHEITAEDRRMTGQIAALAAASHQPDATKQIAHAIATSVSKALPSGTVSKTK